MTNQKSLFVEKMKNEGLSKIEIDNFLYNYENLLHGEETFIPENIIENPNNIAKLNELSEKQLHQGLANSKKLVMIKLNGGLGTSMGLKKAKSLLHVKEGLSFLDIIAKQVERSDIPLVLMNSFNTQKDSLSALKQYEFLSKQKISLDFLQSKVPKVEIDTGKPGIYKQNPALEWCPPGHGDIYSSLYLSGLLDEMLKQEIHYAFISNSDNLGATLNFYILGFIIENSIPFLMEVANRTESDRKGGHLAKRNDGKLILREIAQCSPNDINDFQNHKKYTYFNTNNIWIDLRVLKAKLVENNGNMQLPVIQNKKRINPIDDSSIEVFQLETAMGSAIEVFDNAQAILVDRGRFIPVKKTNDLMKIQSDLYYIDNNFNIRANDLKTANNIIVNLDENYFKKIAMYQERIGNYKISLKDCKSLKIVGDVKFSKDMIFIGDCELIAK